MGAATERGRFVVFEGGESVGKSTQAAWLATRQGAELTFEPGGTRLGQELRRLLLDGAGARLDILSEALLMAADRAQHVAETIRPALEAGRDVVCDRYIGSSLAYQGYGRGLDVPLVRLLSEVATGGLWPDLIVLLDMDPQRARVRGAGGSDRFEALGMDFHRRVRAGYLELASADPARWTVVDADRSPAEVRDDIAALAAERLGWA
ncbi:MAG: dTMP kinase [Acidimicrobiia bacterium]|nr:dTMP kinase [Acidimicrobiia bacterium]